jgi:hypothetical protein
MEWNLYRISPLSPHKQEYCQTTGSYLMILPFKIFPDTMGMVILASIAFWERFNHVMRWGK